MAQPLTTAIRPLVLLQGITGLTGGGSTNLDGIATVGLSVPLNGFVFASGTAYFYQLRAGTDAASSPSIIRPTDFNSGTNAKVWALQSLPVTSIPGIMDLKGIWNSSTNSPALASGVGTLGDVYIVGTAGTTTLDGISSWSATDWAVFDGTAWKRVDNTDQDATSSIKGVIQLAQDLAGTAAAPVVKQASQDFSLSGVITGSFGSDQNDWAPSGISTASVIFLNVTGIIGRNITGIQAPSPATPKLLILINTSGNTATLKNASSSSSAANRFQMQGDVAIPSKWSCILWYDTTSSCWRLLVPAQASYALDTAARTVTSIADLVTAVTSQGSLTGTINNANWTTVGGIVRCTLTGNVTLTGLANGSGGRIVILSNASGGFTLTLNDNDSGSTAANRFSLGGGAITVPSGESIAIYYDTTSSLWRPISYSVLLFLANTWTARQTFGPVSNTQSTPSYSATTNIDWSGAPCQIVTLTGNVTITDSNITAGAMQKIILKADSSGPYTVTWPSWGRVMGAALPASIPASKCVIVALEADGTNDASVYATAVSQT